MATSVNSTIAFPDIVKALPTLTSSQLDKLWEALRLQVRQNYYNEGLSGASKAVTNLLGANDPNAQNITAAISKKRWVKPTTAAAKK